MGFKLPFIANVKFLFCFVLFCFSVDKLANDSKNSTQWTYNWTCIFNNRSNQGNFASMKTTFDSFLDS